MISEDHHPWTSFPCGLAVSYGIIQLDDHWFGVWLQQLQCFSKGIAAVLHKSIDMMS